MKKVVLMGVPHHNNLGDNAIAYAEKEFIKDYLPEYNYYEISEETIDKCVYKVIDYIDKDSLIFLHGGGNFGDEYLYVEEGRRKVIELFPENTIILFPQTMFFSETKQGKEELEKSKKIYSKHKKLILLARESVSYELMKKEFPNNKVIQTPDIVTYLNKSDNTTKREGLLFILRNDVERVTTDEQTEYLEKIAEKYFSKIDYKDIARGAPILAKDRDQKLDEMFSRCRHAQLIITDRLHGMIFAAITSTPCIALKSYNHKITSSKDNFKHLGYIRYIEDVKDVEEQIKYLLNTKFEPYDNEFAKNQFIKVIKEKIKIE